MAINMSTMVYLPCQEMFSVPCTFYRPGQGMRQGRGIFQTDKQDVLAEPVSFYSDQRTFLDIRESEFGGDPPRQGDIVVVPVDGQDKPRGQFEITDVNDNGGGELTLELKKWEQILPSLGSE